MNIFTIIVLLALAELPELPAYARADRRANTAKAIARKRRVGRSAIGAELWFDVPNQTHVHTWMPHPEYDDLYTHGPGKKPSQVHSKSQQNRWDTFEWKTRSYMDNGRVHAGDKKRKGKREYATERIDKIRFQQLLEDYYKE